ncbi:MAG TPA: class I SAM-dependent methyltransferase [Gaiellaceae bacterium]|nr:class I SAM-dependent methyltransferase [Gaiellaceae bacterium]
MSELADPDELRYRDEIESYPDPIVDVPRFIERKELVRKLEWSLHRAGLAPAGTIVDLGAGTCWLSAALVRRPEVDRAIAIEFSRRRLEDLAPIAIAYLGAPAEKIERVVADFYNHGLRMGIADWVFTDAAFHHAADPVRLARVAYDLLRPGGHVVLFREPTITPLRRRRDHGVEDEHGAFEREYRPDRYVDFLRHAGFDASKFPASGGFRSLKARALLRPPMAWLNGVLFSEFTYVGRK